MGTVRLVCIGPESDGQRIDNFLITRLKGVPKSRIYRLIRKGEVRLNSGRVKPDRRLQEGDRVRIPPVRMSRSEPGPTFTDRQSVRLARQLEERILHEDDRLLVINKPAGMAVHGGSGISHGVIEALRALRPRASYLELVHRLDRDTSGCLLIAKRRSALRQLHENLRNNSLRKVYVALLAGRFPRGRKQLSAPLLKNELRDGERISQVRADGKEAKTLFEVISYYEEATLVEARPLTGRTHQIRVHCQYLGHPVLGDRKYGDVDHNRVMRAKGVRRMLLHAAEICLPDGLNDPVGVVKAPLDGDFQGIIDDFNNNKNK
ncbi:MAG: 23S rRNA pseudouridine(955/2504/2580) synthase RluC [Pseudomonadales bacterium]|jgi:23S rRNA pseudouridine955/2504/2580 synthase|nr:23S rRNA pseudouridine(955/2504/2580) synthase RluC [Pseudomonadales bacterium]MDP7358472.1 23S rRNA pseudouridine(955/2504/2580) synthase RluC [Pseudomonadales bacterium]MDP7594915.1 23S rRNA pseudouridine(955/2504/2580) synthase RluC [Pseudomonadales bacterium]HJN50021.1 23S rRNA pseudouridine(955/2504/2580) synthase RluC [Pseudomonadales bacterium]|tara:strand:- start:169 stop:1125 length:957 start_codon:yes stop_codon:yes gene_type:complete